MKLSDVRQAYYDFSSKASDLSRQLSFAGIAVVWVFRQDTAIGLAIPSALVQPALFFCAALVCDLLHYVAATIVWGSFHRFKEVRVEKQGSDPELTAPRYINWPQTVFFILKLLFVAIGYALLLRFLLDKLAN